MSNHKCPIVISEFADSTWDFSPLKLLYDGGISHRFAAHYLFNKFFKIEGVGFWFLILLPLGIAEKPVYASTFRSRCRMVVEAVQPAQ